LLKHGFCPRLWPLNYGFRSPSRWPPLLYSVGSLSCLTCLNVMESLLRPRTQARTQAWRFRWISDVLSFEWVSLLLPVWGSPGSFVSLVTDYLDCDFPRFSFGPKKNKKIFSQFTSCVRPSKNNHSLQNSHIHWRWKWEHAFGYNLN
jgi:hypothetical protein